MPSWRIVVKELFFFFWRLNSAMIRYQTKPSSFASIPPFCKCMWKSGCDRCVAIPLFNISINQRFPEFLKSPCP
jgi:hypothetical protein